MDSVVKGVAPTLSTAVMDAKSALQHRDVVGHVQKCRGGLGLGTGKREPLLNVKLWWGKSCAKKKKQPDVPEPLHNPDRAAG